MTPSLWLLSAALLVLLPAGTPCLVPSAIAPDSGQPGHGRVPAQQSIPWAMALVAELRAGAEPLSALRAAGASQGADRSVATAALGGDASAIFAQLRNQTDLVRAIEAAWELNHATGFALADIIEKLVEGELAAEQTRRMLQVETAGPKHSARVVVLLPLLGLLLAFFVGTNPLAWLLGTRAGGITLAIGLLLNGLGALWASRISRRVLSLL
ncbi:MAG: hypothetical protein K0U64_10490 [Actinomycetia bacterium]|nr:hypothetical protein [Actinomycetes bacterium]